VVKTPESSVKSDIKDFLDAKGEDIYYHMSVQSGYGRRTVDFLICYKGMFIAIEAKRLGGYGAKFQVDLCEEIRDAHGHALIADNVEQVKALFNYIDGRF
jgi:hypothetical protein